MSEEVVVKKKQHGGWREGAGRKAKYGERTALLRVPESWRNDLVHCMENGIKPIFDTVQNHDDSVQNQVIDTVQNHDGDVQSPAVEAVQEQENDSEDKSTEDEIQSLIEKWQALITPERRDAARWANAYKILSELLQIQQKR